MLSERFRHIRATKSSMVLLVLSVCVCCSALFFGSSNQSLPVQNPLEVIGGNAYDFGIQPQNTELRNTFTLINNAKVPLRFTSVESSCGCTWAHDHNKIVGSLLAPNDYLDFTVFLRTGTQQERASGKILLKYQREAEDPQLAQVEEVILQVEAEILPDYRIEPIEIDFGDINGLDVQKVQRRFHITPEQLKSLVVDEIKPSVDALTVKILSTEGNRYDAEVELDVSQFTENQDFRSHLVVSTNSETLPKRIVQVKAQYIAPAEIQPSSIIISSDKDGTVEEEVLIITSSPSQLLRVDCGTDSPIRVEFDSAQKSSRHSVKLFVAPCRNDDINQPVILELSLFPSSGKSVLRSYPVSVYRFKKGDAK